MSLICQKTLAPSKLGDMTQKQPPGPMTPDTQNGLVTAYNDIRFYAQSMIPSGDALDSPWTDMALYAYIGAQEAANGKFPKHILDKTDEVF